MNSSPSILFLLLFSIFCSNSFAGIYKWVDKNGKVHYSDKPTTNAQQYSLEKTAKPNEKSVVVIKTVKYELPKALKDSLTARINKLIDIYPKIFHISPKAPPTVDVTIFGTEQSFNKHKAAFHEGHNYFNGFYSTKTNKISVWRDEGDKEMESVVLHETSHAIIRQLAPNLPLWLEEGLAEYFSNSSIRANNLRVSTDEKREQNLRDWAQKEDIPSLKWYLNMTNRKWHEETAQGNSITYTYAWAMAHFLMSKPTGKRIVSTILRDSNIGGRIDSFQSVTNLYPGGLVKLEYDWYAWITKDKKDHIY